MIHKTAVHLELVLSLVTQLASSHVFHTRSFSTVACLVVGVRLYTSLLASMLAYHAVAVFIFF